MNDEQVTDVVFYAYRLERKLDAAVREIARLEREAASHRRASTLVYALAAVGAASIVLVALRAIT